MLCPSCGAPLPAGEVTCSHCGRSPSPPVVRPQAPQPDRYQVIDDGFTLTISWRWFSWGLLFLLFFTIAWNSFLVGWYAMATSMPGEFGPMRWIAFVFPICHVAVGIGLAYGVLCGFLNSTRITVANGQLRVWHGPIYFPGSLTLDAADIEQIYVARTPSSKDGDSASHSQLKVRLRNNATRNLVSHITSPDEAIFLEQILEKHLRIRDQRVVGEMSHA